MEAAAGQDRGSPPLKPSKFSVYQNPTLSAALTATSLKPSKSTFLCILSISSASAFALLSTIYSGNGFAEKFKFGNLSDEVAYIFAKAVQVASGVVFVGTVFALFKAISWHRSKSTSSCLSLVSPSKGTKNQPNLTKRQLGLLGVKSKVEQVAPDSSKKPPKSKPLAASSSSDVLVPLHPSISGSDRKSLASSNKSNTSGGNKMSPFATPSRSQGSPSSVFLVPASTSSLSSRQNSPGQEPLVKTPWSTKRSSYAKEITTEEQLEQFLAEIDEKITESAGKLATPPPTISGFGVASPNTVASSANTSGTTRSTPLRPVRMSPGSQKFTTPPKKGEGELPPPMSMEEYVEAFEHLGIYPQIEHWRDRLRQWFSSVLVNPLLNKIETSHIQVMKAAAKLNISVTIHQVGNDPSTNGNLAVLSPPDRSKEWQPSFTLEEEGLLHQLRATLVQTLEASTPKPIANQLQFPQQNPFIPVMQECIDAITEHQKLHALMKGEWMKGLLPQNSVRADYTVRRIRELAEGTCVKNYEYQGNGDVYDKKNTKWTHELPTDSHLLLYLFCAFLEHPKWMLHVDPTSYAGAQSSKNPKQTLISSLSLSQVTQKKITRSKLKGIKMEQNLPVITKRVWSIVRALLFMMRKGIFSKKKFMVDLNMVLKRGKIAGAKAIGNLMFHHHHRQVSPKCSMDVSTAAVAKAAVQEYEFSCSNTPNYIFPFNLAAKKKNGGIHNYYNQFFGCAHAPPTHEDDMVTMNAVKVVLEMLNNNDNTMMEATVAASPMLPGFGQTPLARQLRITDSPFPLRDVDEDNGYVDKAAEDFINRFYKDLRQQDKRLSEL